MTPEPGAEPVVSEAWAAYRRDILALAGTDDPGDVQAATEAALRERIDRAAAAGLLRTRPAEGEWSVVELLGHMVDAEIFSSARYRWILAQERPRLEGFDQDDVAAVSDHAGADPEELLAVWKALRNLNLALWKRCDETARERVGIHAERGTTPLRVLFGEIAGHDRFHLRQMDETLKTLGG